MGKSSAPAAPAAPDPTTVANAQSAANVNTAVAQSELNDVNQITPQGTSTFAQTGSTTDPAGDQIPQFTQTVQLTPAEQQATTNQQNLAAQLSGYGSTLASQVPLTPLSFSNLPAIQSSVNTSGVSPLSSPSDFSGETQQAQQAAYNQAEQLVQPGQQYAQKQLTSQLDNAGIPVSSEAYGTAQNLLATQQEAQNNNIAQGAVGQGDAEQQALEAEALSNNQAGFNEASSQAQLANQANAQGATEAQTLQNQPFNELSALIQGAPAIGQPSVISPAQSGIAPTDVTGAYGLNQAAQNTAYQGGLQTSNANNSATTGLIGAGITAAATAAAIF